MADEVIEITLTIPKSKQNLFYHFLVNSKYHLSEILATEGATKSEIKDLDEMLRDAASEIKKLITINEH